MNDLSTYFLPYQVRWLEDNSPIKVWEKSRRIGATYAQSYEDVRDAMSGKIPAVWFSSADESAAREYIEYCEKWVKMFHIAAKSLGLVVLDDERDIKTFVIELKNGVKIHALSSNPKAFRSKGGKVVLDEFAWHDQADKMWAAARPVITWGYPLRILSTHNGKQCRYFKFVEDIKKGRLKKWNLHTTDIFTAVTEGLADKITKSKLTKAERALWIQEQHDNCFDEDTWQQEFCCIAVDEASAFLTYEMITAVEDDQLVEYEDVDTALQDLDGDLYLGVDIGRKKDLTVIWGITRKAKTKHTAFVKTMERAPFHVQRDVLFSILKHPKIRRAGIDATGLGMQLAEEAQKAFGKCRVEAVTFTGKSKEEMAYILRSNFEDHTIWIPGDSAIREDLHSVRKISTAAGNIRFDVAASEKSGHADRFWALALALSAANDYSGPFTVTTRKKRDTIKMTAAY